MSEAAPGQSMPAQSMEDILSSIKRIIADDVAAATRVPPVTVAPVTVAPVIDDEDVLELGPPPADEGEALVSPSARDASRQALASLAGLKLDPGAANNTLDGLVREMLKPMLKTWLDANLPDLVERVVAREVARLVGR